MLVWKVHIDHNGNSLTSNFLNKEGNTIVRVLDDGCPSLQ